MRPFAVALLAATLAGCGACSSGPLDLNTPLHPRACVYVAVDNQNFNRARVYLTDPRVKIGEVEGRTQGYLRYCPMGPTREDFILEGIANSFTVHLASSGYLDPDKLVVLTIGADPAISFIGGA